MQSSYLNYYIRMKTQIWSNLTKTAMSRARAERYMLVDDDDFDEKKGIKPYLQQMYLQSVLILLSFFFFYLKGC